MTTHLILVSHAITHAVRTASFPGDEPLDPPVLSLPAAVALIQKMGWLDHLLMAPERRATETAAALQPGTTFTVDRGLRDCDYGRWTGCRLGDVQTKEPDAVTDWITKPEAKPHGGESLRDVFARVAAWLDERGRIGGRVLAISHPAVIRAAIVHAIGADLQAFWRIDVEPLSLVDLRGKKGQWTLRSLSQFEG